MTKKDIQKYIQFYASQSGKPTLDKGKGGGNPFASSLIELLKRSNLTCFELYREIIPLTKKYSEGFQKPEVISNYSLLKNDKEPFMKFPKRIALVFVYSDYRKAGVTSLNGAKRDLSRIALALKKASFNVKTKVNPTKDILVNTLKEFAFLSRQADIALIYTTGHGCEHNKLVYLLPNYYPFFEKSKHLSDQAIFIPSLLNYLHSKNINLLFYGGCRSLV